MTIYEVLKQEIEVLNSIRLPIKEARAIQQIGMVAADLGECAKAIEQAEQEKVEPEKPELTVVEEPAEEN